jgi:TDG/mug DNA glycosylase family protein
VVKRATAQIDELTPEEIAAGAKTLRRKIKKLAPGAACFVGITGFRWVFALPAKIKVRPGPQVEKIGSTPIYVLPSTSPANAHFSLAQIVNEIRRLKSWLQLLNMAI